MVPSSSGPGRLVLIQKIAGSTPAGITNKIKNKPIGAYFLSYLVALAGGRTRRVRTFKETSEKEKLAFLFPNDAERKGFAKQILTPALTENFIKFGKDYKVGGGGD